MLPAYLGKPQPRQHDYLYWEFHERGFAQAIRTGNHKCFRRNPGQPIEVYDLASDLGERNDIASQNPALVRRAAEIFRTARTDSQLFPVKPARA